MFLDFPNPSTQKHFHSPLHCLHTNDFHRKNQRINQCLLKVTGNLRHPCGTGQRLAATRARFPARATTEKRLGSRGEEKRFTTNCISCSSVSDLSSVFFLLLPSPGCRSLRSYYRCIYRLVLIMRAA